MSLFSVQYRLHTYQFKIFRKIFVTEPNTKGAQVLLEGFKFGFKLQYEGPRYPRESSTLKSARQSIVILMENIDKECKLGRVAGPFSSRPFPTLTVSPLDLVPKKDGDLRVIHHLSYPENDSVNYFIDHAWCAVQYASVDDAMYMIHSLGKGALLAKADIKSAFLLLPIWPGDFDLLGFKLNDMYNFGKTLPIGASISCSLFTKFSTFLQWDVI